MGLQLLKVVLDVPDGFYLQIVNTVILDMSVDSTGAWRELDIGLVAPQLMGLTSPNISTVVDP
jgi:hypothetical protein